MVIQQKHMIFPPSFTHSLHHPLLESGQLCLAILAKINLHPTGLAPLQQLSRLLASSLPAAIIRLLQRARGPIVVVPKGKHVNERHVPEWGYVAERRGHVYLLSAKVARVGAPPYKGVQLVLVHVALGIVLPLLQFHPLARFDQVEFASLSQSSASSFGTAVYHHHGTSDGYRHGRWQGGNRCGHFEQIAVLGRPIPSLSEDSPSCLCGLIAG
mmetsp:Transcript_34119/g.72681  ORF Transcript_34119/g.72681 Transcript_34119/m.72681 type:complete len:213 (-) Transcript_34119:419-1057(-)